MELRHHFHIIKGLCCSCQSEWIVVYFDTYWLCGHISDIVMHGWYTFTYFWGLFNIYSMLFYIIYIFLIYSYINSTTGQNQPPFFLWRNSKPDFWPGRRSCGSRVCGFVVEDVGAAWWRSWGRIFEILPEILKYYELQHITTIDMSGYYWCHLD